MAYPHATFPAFSGGTSGAVLPMQPRPIYFISRHDGMLVPLIPADELPFNIRLQGVTRVLQMDQTYGMQHVGSAPYTGMTFKLEGDGVALHRSNSQPSAPAPHSNGHSQIGAFVNPGSQYLGPDALARQAITQSAQQLHSAVATTTAPSVRFYRRPVSAHESATDWRSSNAAPSSDSTQNLIDAIINSAPGAAEAARVGYTPKTASTPPSGRVPDPEKKKFCTYWIRTGECDYMQQGCFYLHEMPDRETLEKVTGLRTWPRWWAEKMSAVKIGGVGKLRGLGVAVGEEGGIGKGFGSGLKSEEWLKKRVRRGSGVGRDGDGSVVSESESETESAHSDSGKAAITVSKEPPKPAVLKKLVTAATPERFSPKSILSSADLPTTLRKASAASDLISFTAAPLLPSPSPSTSTMSLNSPVAHLTTVSSAESSPRTGQLTPPTPPTSTSTSVHTSIQHDKTPTISVEAKPTRVFVPKGESAAQHIADAQKLVARQHAHRSPPTSTLDLAPPLEEQIQELRKRQHPSRKYEGLMASKHAFHAALGSGGGVGGEQVSRRTVKGACRVRRPAPVSLAPTAGGAKGGQRTAVVEKK